MSFKLWLENFESSCLKGEYIYYSLTNKLQNAIRHEKSRGHYDLIVNFYIQKNKKNLIKFYDDLQKDSRIDQEKLKNQFRIIRNQNAYSRYFFFPPENKTDITSDNFKIHYNSIFNLIKKDIYLPNKFINQEEALSYFKSDHQVLKDITLEKYGDPNLLFHAMKYYKIIFVRTNVHFDIDEFDNNRIKKCIEAICNKEIDIESFNTEIFINVFSSPKSSKSFTTTIRDLFSNEKPQAIQSTEIKGAGLKVDPLSTAGIAQRDVSREIWKQRTSESTIYKVPRELLKNEF